MKNNKEMLMHLYDEFILNSNVKKMRKIAGGDMYTIIYLKLLLMKILHFVLQRDDWPNDLLALAHKIDEDVDNVDIALGLISAYGLMQPGTVECDDNV